MTTFDRDVPASTEAVSWEPNTTFDLIICRGDRIVLHEVYESPQQRLRLCFALLTKSDIGSRLLGGEQIQQVMALESATVADQLRTPDQVLNSVAKLCRTWGVHVYLSSTAKKDVGPRKLYSVITAFGPGQTMAEHFESQQARRASLVERAEQFFTGPGHLPQIVVDDEQRLAALVAAFLMPATITLTEAVRNDATGVYVPDSHLCSIR